MGGTGGGVYNAGTFNMTSGSIGGNGASEGGGIYTTGTNASSTLMSVSFLGNGAAVGGGFYLDSGTLTIGNCSFMFDFAVIGTGGAVKGGSTYINNGSVFVGDEVDFV
jgi:hypothetical protein